MHLSNLNTPIKVLLESCPPGGTRQICLESPVLTCLEVFATRPLSNWGRSRTVYQNAPEALPANSLRFLCCSCREQISAATPTEQMMSLLSVSVLYRFLIVYFFLPLEFDT